MSAGLKKTAIGGGLWALAEKFSAQIVTFVVTLFLARLLTPTDYGTVALIAIFVSVAEVVADSGFGKALIQKKDVTDLDFNSVFYCSLLIAAVVYAVLFVSAPLVADFYNQKEIASLLRVVSVIVIFHAINSVQDAELTRRLQFKRSFSISLMVAFVAGVVGITLAFLEYGAWALVWSQVAGGATGSVARWFIIAWRPRLMFSFDSLKTLFSYGWKMTVSSLIARIYSKLYGLLIGKVYAKDDLAFVDRARFIPGPFVDAIDGTMRRVSFPVLAKVQDDIPRFRSIMRHMMQMSMFWLFPIMTGCAICAEPITLIMYGKQWLPMVPYLRIMCFVCAIYPFHTINLQAVAAIGRSDVFLWLEIVKKVLGLVALCLTARLGVMTIICVSAFMMGPMSVILNSWPNRKLLGYSIVQQIADILPSVFACVVMAAVCCSEKMLIPAESFLAKVGVMILQIASGAFVYLFVASRMRMPAFIESAKMIGERLPNCCACLKGWIRSRYT